MKKLIALFITLLYICSNACFAFSELYYLKNVQTSSIEPVVKSAFANRNYNIKNQNPIYGVSANNNEDYAIVVLQQSGANMFYFYTSNDDKRLNKNILKTFNNNGIDYEQSQNANIISIYENIAQRTLSQGNSNYIFTDNNYVAPVQNTYQSSNSSSLKGYVAQLTKGTTIPVYLQDAINTATTSKGDEIIAVLTSDVKYNGYTVFPQGSRVYGTLKVARHATYGSRNGKVVIDFNRLVTPENKTYSISTEEVDFTVTNDGKVGRVAGSVVTGALIGGLMGLLVGAMSHHVGSSTAIGAGVGAGAAMLSGAAERGVDAEIPSFTEMELKLTDPVNVTINY